MPGTVYVVPSTSQRFDMPRAAIARDDIVSRVVLNEVANLLIELTTEPVAT